MKKAVILVGGEGTRLRPLTCNTVKSMVPVVNKPFLEHVIHYLRIHGVSNIVLALCYLPECIRSYFGDGGQFGVRLFYKIENSPLGTAGAVKNAEEYLDEPFFVLNGDVFTDFDLTAMSDFHHQQGAEVTIALTPVEDPTLYGIVETEATGRIKRFVEKPSWDEGTTNMINAGIYILEPDILKHIPKDTRFMFEHDVFPTLLRSGVPIFAYSNPAYWIDIGTPENYLQLNHDILRNESTTELGMAARGGVAMGRECSIHPSAKIEGPVVMGANCTIGQRAQLRGPIVIGSNCKIGDDAILEGAILWQGVQLGPRVILKNCIVADNCHIGANSRIEDYSVLSDDVMVTDSARLEPGSRIWPGTKV